jgi:hypothetical protein
MGTASRAWPAAVSAAPGCRPAWGTLTGPAWLSGWGSSGTGLPWLSCGRWLNWGWTESDPHYSSMSSKIKLSQRCAGWHRGSWGACRGVQAPDAAYHHLPVELDSRYSRSVWPARDTSGCPNLFNVCLSQGKNVQKLKNKYPEKKQRCRTRKSFA